MKVSSLYHSHPEKLALELTMRDVLDGMEELAGLDLASFDGSSFEILSIEPPKSDPDTTRSPRQKATLLPFPRLAESA